MIFVQEKEFYKKAAGIAIPITMQSMITIGVNMMDTIMLGSLGEVAISASSLANQFINLFHICCMGMGMGASVLTARFWGRKDLLSLKKSITIMLRLCVVLATLFAAATLLIPEKIMLLYTTEENVISEGVSYFNWSVLTYWLVGLSLTLTVVMRSVGLAKIPLYASIASFSLNIAANYVFIFGKFGAPAMGVAGAAFGTLLSRVLETCIILFYFFLRDKRISYRLRDIFLPCKDMAGEYLRISIPVLVSDTILGLGNNAVAMVIGRLGSSFVSANAITTVTQQLSTVFIQGISQAGCITIGHTLGSGTRDRAQREGVTFLGLGIAIGVVAGAFIMMISPVVIGFYNITEETRGIAQQLMIAVAFIVTFQSANSILTKGVLRGGGDTGFLMVADVLFLWAVSIPLGVLAGLVWHLPAFWIYTCLKIDQVIKAVWCVFRLKSGKWIKAVKGSTV